MADFNHDVNPCASVGHTYANILVVRCEHRESYHVVASVWRDDPSGETTVMARHELTFGPFDTPSDVEAHCVRYLVQSLRTCQGFENSMSSV